MTNLESTQSTTVTFVAIMAIFSRLPLLALIFICATSLGRFPAHAAKPYFINLGDLPGGMVAGTAYGVSDDGSVVVGDGVSSKGFQAFRWTRADGMVALDDLPGGENRSQATSVSGDGSRIAGIGFSEIYTEAVLWSPENGVEPLGRLSDIRRESIAHAISRDGSVVVGAAGREPVTSEAFRWTETEGMVGLGDLPGGDLDFISDALGVSDDGSVIVGMSQSSLGYEAFRWTSETGMIGLGDLPGGAFLSSAEDVSSDGSVVVGASAVVPAGTATLNEAFRWTSDTGMVGLGHLPGGNEGVAWAVSGDGSVVMGWERIPLAQGNSDHASIWDAENGMRDLQHVLMTDFGLEKELVGWDLQIAFDISSDGRFIVGTGRNPNGGFEAWLVHVPEPSTYLLVLVTVGAVLGFWCFRQQCRP